MDVGLADWKKCRSIVRRIVPSAQDDDVDDIASDALLIVLQRGTGLRRAVIDALRNKYGKMTSGTRQRRWSLHHALSLDETALATETHSTSVNADDLARRLARGRPAWVCDALLLISRGYTMKEAAQKCGKVYDSLYSHLRR